MVKLEQKVISESERQARKGVGKGSGIWGEFLPLCLDLQQPDTSHVISPCLSFQPVKQEHSGKVMHVTSLI